ncbi:MAG: Cell surface glycoprotein 1 [Candidatus Woesebacteria bacterium GW2011_GWA1_40_43]|uniref:Cell surface glycoprotein 1 n=1 Tax=Candidatus Woesebacteria bacterium GW2011_GWA1_40_43 TaxID=1618553 RepID=A0A0G0SQH1_9BACT|nr:MAG: Cell surface glycoprotein 1 [Candidatus Woesebacteria bacterium GW2011_GWA1_40_43]
MMYISMIHIIRTKSLHFGILFIILFFGLLPRRVSAQVVINEVFPNPSGSSSEPDEFIELFNLGTEPVVITGWQISDTQGTVKTYSIKEDRSFSRIPNGVGNFVADTDVTELSANISPPTPEPTPVPQTPTPTPTPTQTPILIMSSQSSAKTPTPVPTKTPSPVPVKTPLRTNSSTPIATISAGISEVLGIRAGPTGSPSASIEASPDKKANFPLLPIILIFAGVCFVAVPIFSIIKDGKKDYTDENEKQSNDAS